MKLNNLDIKHLQERQMFSLKLQNSFAYLNYTLPQQGVIDLKATYVPKKSRGKGVGSTMVNHVLEYARENHLKIIPTCPFVKEYINEHPEYEEMIYELDEETSSYLLEK